MRILPPAALLAAALVFVPGPGTSSVTSPGAAAGRPSLIVLVAVDQMLPAYFTRYAREFSGGLGRLHREGILFTDARQDHAVTETAPGHATMLSGRSPAATGIVSNRLGVSDPAHELVGAPGWGASPWRFRGTTLYDWLLARDSGAAVLAVSRKDRGAILPVGRGGRDVYWYDGGGFTTSTWYRRELPDWLVRWNARRGAARLAGVEWSTLRDPATYAEADSQAYEHEGADVAFPHRIPRDTSLALANLDHFPWMDSLTLDVALEGAKALRLGARGRTDLLVVSLSATDVIGHAWGPASREIHDHLLRLDLWLGQFLDSLGTMVPASETVVAFTADHGVVPFPEAGGPGGRTSLAPVVRDLEGEYGRRFRTRFAIQASSGLLSADVAALRARGVNVDSLSRVLARRVGALPGVAAVITPATIEARARSSEEARLWQKTVPSDFGWLMAASLKPGWIWADSRGWTTHGTTAPDDTHVPLIFLVPGRTATRVARRVTTEDIGPTLAALAGVPPTEPVTGKALPEVTSRR